MRYCPMCTKTLVLQIIDDLNRLTCPDEDCGFVFWNNPLPVVAAIIETDAGIVLAHNKSWPVGNYSVISGFLEAGETPEHAVKREALEELNWVAQSHASLIGIYPLAKMNQIVLGYYLKAAGNIHLNDELDTYKLVAKDKLMDCSYFAKLAMTKHLIADWLKTKKS